MRLARQPGRFGGAGLDGVDDRRMLLARALLDTAAARTGAAAVQVVDVADAAQVDAAMAASLAALGDRLDILVAGAGITGPNATLRDYPVEAWRRVIDVNLNGVFHCNRAAVPAMERRGYGSRSRATSGWCSNWLIAIA